MYLQIVWGIMRGAGVLCRQEKHRIWGQHGIFLPVFTYQIRLADNHNEVITAIKDCYGGATDPSISIAAELFSRRDARSFVFGFCHSIYGELIYLDRFLMLIG